MTTPMAEGSNLRLFGRELDLSGSGDMLGVGGEMQTSDQAPVRS